MINKEVMWGEKVEFALKPSVYYLRDRKRRNMDGWHVLWPRMITPYECGFLME